MRIIGLAGWSGSGKTTLITKLHPAPDRARPDASRRSSTRITASTSTSRARIRFIHRAAGATEVLIVLGAALRDAARVARRAGVGPAPSCSPSCRRSISCWSRASSATPYPKLEIHRAANGKPLLHPDDPHIVAIASDAAVAAARACRWSTSTTSRRSSTCCSTHAAPIERGGRARGARDGAAHRRLLRVLRSAAAGRRDGAADRRARRAGRRDRGRSRLRAARGRVLAARRHRAARSAAVRQFRRRRLCGAPRAISTPDGETRAARSPAASPPAARPTRALERRRGDAHLHRRADAGRRRHRVHAGGRAAPRATRVIVPAGLEARRQPAARRRGCARGAVPCCRPAGGSRPQDVALAAAVGLTALTVRRRVRVALFSTGDEIVEPGAPRRAGGDLRRQPLSARRRCWSGSAPRSPISASCADEPAALAQRARRRRPRITTWC